MRQDAVRHEFVEFVPLELEEGVLYVSIPFATAAHKCGCGCGNKVITPLTPTDWKLIFNGESVSLSPSIGNWSFPCRSHYWIKRGRISWSSQWSAEEIAAGRRKDKLAKQRQFAPAPAKSPSPNEVSVLPLAPTVPAVTLAVEKGFWKDVWHWLRRWGKPTA